MLKQRNSMTGGAARLEAMPPVPVARRPSQTNHTPTTAADQGDRRNFAAVKGAPKDAVTPKAASRHRGTQADSPSSTRGRVGAAPSAMVANRGTSPLDAGQLRSALPTHVVRRGDSPSNGNYYNLHTPTNNNNSTSNRQPGAGAGTRPLGNYQPGSAAGRQVAKERVHSRSRMPDSAPTTPYHPESYPRRLSAPAGAYEPHSAPRPLPPRYVPPPPSSEYPSNLYVSPPVKPPPPQNGYTSGTSPYPLRYGSAPLPPPPPPPMGGGTPYYDEYPNPYHMGPPPPPQPHPHHHHHHHHQHQHHQHHQHHNQHRAPPPPMPPTGSEYSGPVSRRPGPPPPAPHGAPRDKTLLYNPMDPYNAPILSSDVLLRAHVKPLQDGPPPPPPGMYMAPRMPPPPQPSYPQQQLLLAPPPPPPAHYPPPSAMPLTQEQLQEQLLLLPPPTPTSYSGPSHLRYMAPVLPPDSPYRLRSTPRQGPGAGPKRPIRREDYQVFPPGVLERYFAPESQPALLPPPQQQHHQPPPPQAIAFHGPQKVGYSHYLPPAPLTVGPYVLVGYPSAQPQLQQSQPQARSPSKDMSTQMESTPIDMRLLAAPPSVPHSVKSADRLALPPPPPPAPPAPPAHDQQQQQLLLPSSSPEEDAAEQALRDDMDRRLHELQHQPPHKVPPPPPPPPPPPQQGAYTTEPEKVQPRPGTPSLRSDDNTDSVRKNDTHNTAAGADGGGEPRQDTEAVMQGSEDGANTSPQELLSLEAATPVRPARFDATEDEDATVPKAEEENDDVVDIDEHAEPEYEAQEVVEPEEEEQAQEQEQEVEEVHAEQVEEEVPASLVPVHTIAAPVENAPLFAADVDALITVEPLRQATEDLFIEFISLEEQYVRVNGETGEEIEDFVHVVEVNRDDRVGERMYISKGLHQEMMPMLRFPEDRLIPAYDLYYNGFINLCTAMWLCRFQPIGSMRELSQEAGWIDPEAPSPVSHAKDDVFFPAADFNAANMHLPERLDAVFAWCVRSVVEQQVDIDSRQDANGTTSQGQLFANACVQLMDRNNLRCWPDSAWQNALSDSLADHTRRFLCHCVSLPEEEAAESPSVSATATGAQQRALTPEEVQARQTWRLFLGATQWNYEDGVEQPFRPVPEAVAPLAYSFVSRARAFNLTGGLGSLYFSVITQQLPEAAFYDCMLMLEKLHLALLYSHKSAVSQQRQREIDNNFTYHNGAESPLLRSDVWGAHFHALETGRLAEKFRYDPSLYVVVLQLVAFFPLKNQRSLHILLAALLEDLVELGAIRVETRGEGGELSPEDTQALLKEGTEAIFLLLLKVKELEHNTQMVLAHSDMALLTGDAKVNFFLLRTKVPVQKLFSYRDAFPDGEASAPVAPPAYAIDTAHGTKSRFVEACRTQYLCELLQYAMEVQVVILDAVERDRGEEEERRLAAKRARAKRANGEASLSFDLQGGEEAAAAPHGTDEDEEMSIATVRSILLSLHDLDPAKQVGDLTEYLRHLLLLYFEEHTIEDSYVEDGSPRQVSLARRTTSELSLQDWFGTDPLGGARDQLCDEVCVHVQELAALCPRVLGRRCGFPEYNKEL